MEKTIYPICSKCDTRLEFFATNVSVPLTTGTSEDYLKNSPEIPVVIISCKSCGAVIGTINPTT